MSFDQSAATVGRFARPWLARTTATYDRLAPIRLWLWLVAASIVLMVLVGGATRLTESGLAITEWEPLFGAIPPLTETAWQSKFEAYTQIPQFALHPEMTLSEFRTIFFWEWSHRLIGRALGLVVALPFAGFWLAGRLTAGLKLRVIGLLLLVGIQGAVGWWMVKSGLTQRTEVSQYRLATHLLLATFTLGYVIWIAQGLAPARGRAVATANGRLRTSASLLLALVFCQIGLGALVAGLRAGLIYNTWPTMGGRLIPPATELLRKQPIWANFFENLTTVQFQHRSVAYALLVVAIVHAFDARRLASGTATSRSATALAALVVCQAAIGIAALLLAVPIAVALAHQGFAMVVFAMAVVHRRALSQPAFMATPARA